MIWFLKIDVTFRDQKFHVLAWMLGLFWFFIQFQGYWKTCYVLVRIELYIIWHFSDSSLKSFQLNFYLSIWRTPFTFFLSETTPFTSNLVEFKSFYCLSKLWWLVVLIWISSVLHLYPILLLGADKGRLLFECSIFYLLY